MKRLLFVLIILLPVLGLKAQIVDVCGSDTVTLTVDNYVSGLVEWQESMDNVNWSTIPNTTGLIFKFHPTEVKYYRAAIKTSACNLLYSEVSLVQLPPVAIAGSDRTIGNPSTYLMGNAVSGATGMWKIISGSGGVIDDPTNPRAKFTGVNKKSYTLTWTLTNSCGESTDTVMIDFDEVIVKNNFIMVDNTDSLMSDSTEMSTGRYRIRFSDPAIAPFDSMILIGIRDDYKFMRKVVSYTLQNSVYTFETVQGTFQDVIESGCLNVGDAVNQAMIEENLAQSAPYYRVRRINQIPTRETLKEYASSRGIHIYYTDSGAESASQAMQVRQAVASASTASDGFTLKIPDCTLLQSPDEALSFKLSDAWVKIAPNFVLDFKIGWFTIKNIKVGIDNGYFQTNYKFGIEAKVAKSFEKEKEICKMSQNICFSIGALPVWIETKFDIKAVASLSVAAKLSYEQTKNYKASMTALIEGDKIKNLHVNYKPLTVVSTTSQTCDIQGELDASLEVGPEVQFKLYSIVGPYIYIPAKATLNVCANTKKNWQANADLFFEGKLGAKAELFGWTLFDCSFNLFKTKSLYNLKMPYSLDVISGNNQQGEPNTQLPVPVKFKVTSNKGFGVPFVRVRYAVSNGNGVLSDSVATTDLNGEAKVYWTPGTTGNNAMTARVLDCSNTDVSGSPLLVYANAPVECGNSNFAVGITTAGNYKVPVATGGHPPYTYSTNGKDYTTTIPQFPAAGAGNYTVYVKDKYGCIESKSFVVESVDICRNSLLTADIFTQVNFITVTGKNGVAPYQYALDDSTTYSGTNAFYKLAAGNHVLYIKDQNNCRNSVNVTIENSKAAINAVYPLSTTMVQGNTKITFYWKAGNYMTDQRYDIYLARSNAAYAVIGSNLSADSLFYNTPLDVNSSYKWKVVVKTSAGVELDELSSSFTTSTAKAMANPVLYLPAQSAILTSSEQEPVKLKWNNQGSDFLYDLYCDTKNAVSLVANNLSDTTYTVMGVTPGIKYYWKVNVKAKATGEHRSSETRTFKTIVLPVITKPTISSVEITKATVSYAVNSIGGDSTCVHGICWSTTSSPTTNATVSTTSSGIGTFVKALSQLTSSTTYYVRPFATNAAGTVYGTQITFTTLAPVDSTVTDIDGNVYHTITIGTQTWMLENLKTTHYANGDLIPNVTSVSSWINLTSGAWCYYNNDISYNKVYGKLYNWYAVSDNRKLAPQGWHIPTYEEWGTLSAYLASNVGGQMKEAGTAHWCTPNTNATNASGFTGLPGGYLYVNGSFLYMNQSGNWWTASSSGSYAYGTALTYSDGNLNRYVDYMVNGFSVRCVKDK